MFIYVRSNDLKGEGVAFNTEYVVRVDSTRTNVRIKMIDNSTVIITREEFKHLNKTIFKVTKLDDV